MRRAGLNGEVTYGRDAITKGLSTVKLGGMTQTFTYDGFGRLASEAQDSSTAVYGPALDSLVYDAAGNRTGVTGSYVYSSTNAALGRPKIAGDTAVYSPGDSLVYDAAGNPVWWKNKTTNGYDSLTWDPENRLTRLRRYSSGGTLQIDVSYTYDGVGRRVRKLGTGSGVNPRLYVWNGWDLLAETDTGGTARVKYTYFPDGIDLPLSMRDYSGGGSGTTSLFHLDGQGNVYLLTEPAMGQRRSEYRFRAWGDRYSAMTENVASPLTYKAREEDRETGLIYMRHRYYSPRLERFLNTDPIGILGGLNVFVLAANDPTNRNDPFGLISEPHNHANAFCANGGVFEIAFNQCWGWDGHLHERSDPSGMAPDYYFHTTALHEIAELIGRLLFGGKHLGYLVEEGVRVDIYEGGRFLGGGARTMGNSVFITTWPRNQNDIDEGWGNMVSHEMQHVRQHDKGLGVAWWWLKYLYESWRYGKACNKFEIEADRVATGEARCEPPHSP